MRYFWSVLGLALLGCVDATPVASHAGGDLGLGGDAADLGGDVEPIGDAEPVGGAGGGDAAVMGGAGGSDAAVMGGAGGSDAAVMGGAGGVGGSVPCVETVVVGGLTVFKYEASRPDATAVALGEAGPEGGACSQAGVLPWASLTRLQAEAACVNTGFHLCTDAEWTLLCGGPEGYPYPYGEVHQPGRCNDHISGESHLLPTGAKPECTTFAGIYDVSGNVWEMNADGFRRGASWRINAVQFHTEVTGCIEKFNIIEDYYDDDLGFRCCR